MVVNEKNLPTFTLEQVIAFAFMSNKPDAIEIDTSDRRYLVLETEAAPHVEGDAYYARLYALLDDPVALGAILHALMTRDLKGYNICSRAPETAAKYRLQKATASDIMQCMREHDGEAPFRYKVVRVAEIDSVLPRHMHRSTNKIIEALKALGYTSFEEPIEPGKDGERFRVWLHPARENRDSLSIEDVQAQYRAERPDTNFFD
jgi:hypothetical protein